MSDRSPFQAIEHLKSGLALSSHSGCPLNCAYCLLHAGSPDGGRINAVADTDELARRLMLSETLFLNGMTPLFINNRTDPFLPAVEKHTLQILDRLAENGVRSPVVLISKLVPSVSLRDYCGALPLILIYSYSALEEDVNYHGISHIGCLSEFMLPGHLYHYMRPIIPGKNDDAGTVGNTVRQFAEAGFSGSIVSGIRITKGNYRYLDSAPEAVGNHKHLAASVYSGLLQDPVLSGLRYPLFRHTSCAIDHFMKRGNRLGYYQRDSHCNPDCVNRERCAHSYALTDEACSRIAARFPSMVFSYDAAGGIAIDSPVSQEVTAFLKNAYGVRVTAKQEFLSPSEEVLADG